MSEQEQVEQRAEAPEAGAVNGASEEASEQEATAAAPQAELASQLAEAERQRDEYLDQWRRSAAEFQNFRKREERLRVERERSANARLLLKLLPVLDDLQRGAQHVPETIAGDEWVSGMLAIERKIWNILEQENVSRIEAEAGSDFNPNLHEAIVSQLSEEHDSGQIVQVLEAGYRHHDNILRPARVIVAQ